MLSPFSLEYFTLIVMPTVTPGIKVDAVRALGAQVLLSGNNFDAAKAIKNCQNL